MPRPFNMDSSDGQVIAIEELEAFAPYSFRRESLGI